MAFLITMLLGACQCDVANVPELIDAADVVFRAELTNLSENVEGCSETGTWNFSFHVLEVYKGEVAERVNVQSDPPDASPCGIPPEREGEFVVYARKLDNFREYRSDLCMGTKLVKDAALEELGEGHAPGNVGCYAVSSLQTLGWLIAIAGLLHRLRLNRAE
jgi:hypothetical protein